MVVLVLQHEHTLTLVDLNSKYPHDEEVYDDEEDFIIKQAFQCPCNRCYQEITYFHRSYYKCDQCDYLLHKLCAELPANLEHASHRSHTLTLFLDESQRQCGICKSILQYKQLCYHCSQCMFTICLDCGMDRVQYHTIYHPSHQHPLIPVHRQKQILAKCDACKKEHKGVFYHCVTCFSSFIHKDCVFKPKRLLIQDSTCGLFFHTHPLILNYSFPKVDQEAKFYPPCRICDNSFFHDENRWFYKCNKCRYYVHLDCAKFRSKSFNPGMKDEASLLHLPLSDHTYNIMKAFVLKETNEMSITHNSDRHRHPLILVNTQNNDKVIKGLCDGCVTPIMFMPFYKCTHGCDFVLHEWCTRLPVKLKGQKYHLGHTLILLPKVPNNSLGFFTCHVCFRRCNGFAYSCVKCHDCYMDVCCAIMPEEIVHKSHPYHLLSRVRFRHRKDYCRMCLSDFKYTETSFSCAHCDFHLHPACALLLPDTVRPKYDKHVMTLCYSPVENYDGDYFCEVCEEELNPNAFFYHCHECIQSIHIACAPLIPQSKAYIYGLSAKGVSTFVGTKLGSIHKTRDHPHPLSLLQNSWGDYDICSICNDGITGYILKCKPCKFAIHEKCFR